MSIGIPKYEGERGNEGGDQYTVVEASDLNAVIDRVNAIAAQVGGAVGALAALPHVVNQPNP